MKREQLYQFPRQSTWAVIGLTVITVTFYFPFWLRKHSRVINQLLPNSSIVNWWFPVCLCITALNFGMIISEIITNDNPVIVGISKLMNQVDIILTVIWIFKVRNRMNILLDAEKNTPSWYHALWTLLFGIFYLQYKLNKLQDQKNHNVEQNGRANEGSAGALPL